MKHFFLAFIFSASCLGCTDKPVPPPQKHGPHRIVRPVSVNKRPLVVAVIDTGFGYHGLGNDVKLCKSGHKDFTGFGIYAGITNTKDLVPGDRHGHGTHIAGLIDKYAKLGKADYCLVILKYYDPDLEDPNAAGKNSLAAIQYATEIHADIINYSGGGNEALSSEIQAVKKYLDQGGIMFAAAGNMGSDMDKNPYYPAMDDERITVVGNVDEKGHRVFSSNFGSPINCWETGNKIKMFEMIMTGTSQSTAIATGKFIAGKPCGVK